MDSERIGSLSVTGCCEYRHAVLNCQSCFVRNTAFTTTVMIRFLVVENPDREVENVDPMLGSGSNRINDVPSLCGPTRRDDPI